MDRSIIGLWRRLMEPEPAGPSGHLLSRWLFLRAIGVIYFSAFYALIFQVQGLIGPEGILPAGRYLQAVRNTLGHSAYWFAPTLLWLGSGTWNLQLICWGGLIASVALFFNLWPRGMLAICFVCFLSFVAAAQDFSGYQSDGMLLASGFLCLFFAPPGWRPGLGRKHAPSRAALYLLRWIWFRIYFESGVAKMRGGDPEWRNFTAMDEYYQNGPLPTWLGWYAQQLPHWFHAGTVFVTLAMELGLVWMVFLPRRFRLACFFIATGFEAGIILTANYAFLNYLVLALGILLLDDRFLTNIWRKISRRSELLRLEPAAAEGGPSQQGPSGLRPGFARLAAAAQVLIFVWIFYATIVPLLAMLLGRVALPRAPVRWLEPFRVANEYGLFAIMTRGRYEIEFQGSNDNGRTWIAYPFRYKPQDPEQAPGIYAPYQPRFDWNLWFASLESWRNSPFVAETEVKLLRNDAAVLSLFAGHPFGPAPPRQIRTVLWQYWFTNSVTRRTTGAWWRREFLGLYGPALERTPDGSISIIQLPEARPAAPE